MRKFNEAKREETRRHEEAERETKGETKLAGPILLVGSLATSHLTVEAQRRSRIWRNN